MNTIVLILLLVLLTVCYVFIHAVISIAIDAIRLRHKRNKLNKSITVYEKYIKDHVFTWDLDNVKKAQNEKQANENYYKNGFGKFTFTK